jgi:bla regulator protein BlaR1
VTSTAFLEVALSLTIQCTVVLVSCLWLTRRCNSSESADKLWGICHVIVLMLVATGVFLPHIRLLHSGDDDILLARIAASTVVRTCSSTLRFLWIAGASLLAFRTIWSLVTTSLLVGRTKDFPLLSDTNAMRCSTETANRLRESRICILTSEDLVTPFCWQLQHPVIVLPESLRQFPDDELDAVLRHELAHLEAQHPLRLFLQRLVEIIFWFHPLVWITSQEASLQRELSSDRRANHSAVQASAFLRGMARLADFCVSRTSSLAAGLGFSGAGRSILQRRIDQLLSLDWSADSRTKSYLGQAALLIGILPIATLIWVPINDSATGRTIVSPWPQISASVLREFGVAVRDYEVDNHRLMEHIHRREGL